MELSFAHVEAIFSAQYDLAVPTPAFRGRLQHLQRSKFPTGVNTGKGKPAIYGWRQVIQLSVALDLIDSGLSPDVATGLVLEESRELLFAASSFGTTLSFAELVKAADTGKLAIAKRPFVLTSARALYSLGELPDGEILLSVVPATAFLGQMRAANPRAATGTYIDLGSRLSSILKAVSRLAQQELGDVVSDFREWATQHVINP